MRTFLPTMSQRSAIAKTATRVDAAAGAAAGAGDAVDAPLPEFTVRNVALDIYHAGVALVVDPATSKIVAPALVGVVSLVAKIIIRYVPYTEIDFSTYMQQVELVNDGELDYARIGGDSGPIVYPAGFVQVYQFLYQLTDGGAHLETAQFCFSLLLTLTTVLAMTTFFTAVAMPPWVFYLLVASKRLYSIYLLRLFNDCFATAAMVGVVVLLQQAAYWSRTSSRWVTFALTAVASDLFSLAISVKMNALLYLPGFLVVAFFLVRENVAQFAAVLAIIPLVQLMVGWRFLLPLFNDEDAQMIRWNYLTNAFDFGRQFLYQWTVNWRFVPEATFQSSHFAHGLLAAHVVVVGVFALTRYLSFAVVGKPVRQVVRDAVRRPFSATAAAQNLYLDPQHGPRLVLLTMATSNVIGVLFARSLHYQFLSWYCWQLPFLLWLTGWPAAVSVVVWVAHELCWNTFPSTAASSATLVTILTAVLYGTWRNTSVWWPAKKDESKSL